MESVAATMSIGKVDATRKATISLGGSCRLRCTHCYITAPQFRFQRRQSIDETIGFLESQKGAFDAICISGDTDPLLEQERFCQLLTECASRFPKTHLMFTTRLIPTVATLETVNGVGRAVATGGQLFAPAVSFLTYTYPNGIEDPKLVPDSEARIQLVRELAAMGFPVLAAMRPTLPFEIVSRNEVEMLIGRLADSCAAILGEVFIVDESNSLALNLGLIPVVGALQPMTFLAQPGLWRKWRFEDEIEFARSCALRQGVPFFLRSMSAIRYLETEWDYHLARRRHSAHLPASGCHDDQDP